MRSMRARGFSVCGRSRGCPFVTSIVIDAGMGSTGRCVHTKCASGNATEQRNKSKEKERERKRQVPHYFDEVHNNLFIFLSCVCAEKGKQRERVCVGL